MIFTEKGRAFIKLTTEYSHQAGGGSYELFILGEKRSFRINKIDEKKLVMSKQKNLNFNEK